MDKAIRYEEQKYGFGYGAANVERVFSREGHVVLKVYTKHRVLELRVTPAGRKIKVVNERKAEKFEKETFTQEASP